MQVILGFARSLLAAALAFSMVTGAQPVQADPRPEPPRPLRSAFHAMARGDWPRAAELAARDGAAAQALIEWHRLRAGRGTLPQYMAFIAAHPDWPGMDYLRKRGEAQLDGAGDAEILAYFRAAAPQTGQGVLLRAGALERTGETGEAEASIVLAWRNMELSAEDHLAFLNRYAALLKPHHAARLDMALWRGLTDDANRMALLVDESHWQLAEARRALQTDAGNVDTLIEALPKALADDPGLAHDRFEWRIRKGRSDEARELMLERSARPGGLGLPEEWARRRRDFARADMRAGQADRAYRLASTHQLRQGSDFADLEWLSGYLALRKLQRPDTALAHFQRMRDAVQTPISLGRAYYWIGRAEEAAGHRAKAQAAYEEGALYQTSFYGILAAEKADVPFDMDLTGIETFPDWRQAPFMSSDLREAAMLLLASGQEGLGERFLTQLAQGLDRVQLGQLGAMMEERGEAHLEVVLGKAGAGNGIVVPRHYYPLHPMREMDLPVPMELALSIARRESEFDPGVTSHVGAGGLMQLMPGTARDVARSLGISHESTRVWGDWAYNAQLGSAYLAGLAADFSGNVLLVSAGYNAGPGRPARWISEYGDPRSRVVDAVDWIEHIPFNETRNYVMRVAESLPIYRARLGQDPLPVPFSEELKGSTLLPAGD